MTGRLAALGVVGALLGAAEASAAETVIYSYDALGRLTATTHSGGTNNGMSQQLQYDRAGNRTSYTVAGSQNLSPPPENIVIVVPLNGFTIIPIATGN